jgi:hypothetical protein
MIGFLTSDDDKGRTETIAFLEQQIDIAFTQSIAFCEHIKPSGFFYLFVVVQRELFVHQRSLSASGSREFELSFFS